MSWNILSIPSLNLSDLMIALNGHYAGGNCQNIYIFYHIFSISLSTDFRDLRYTFDQNKDIDSRFRSQ